LKAGGIHETRLELNTEPCMVEVPPDLSAALAGKPGEQASFDRLPFSIRMEYVRQIVTARAEETLARRISAILTVL
jgi:uncharacterized protein YdeI (YjbR/CyaY-like superfamily)